MKGYDLGGGEYVILTPEELASVAPGASRTIEVTDFVDLADIDPIYFDKPYFLAPNGKNGDRAYELLRRVMAETNKVAIATFVMREKQYLVAVRPEKSALVLETLLFADEVRDPVKEIDVLPVEASFESREIEMAKLFIDSMTTAWEPERYQRHLPRARRGADRPEATRDRGCERGTPGRACTSGRPAGCLAGERERRPRPLGPFGDRHGRVSRIRARAARPTRGRGQLNWREEGPRAPLGVTKAQGTRHWHSEGRRQPGRALTPGGRARNPGTHQDGPRRAGAGRYRRHSQQPPPESFLIRARFPA